MNTIPRFKSRGAGFNYTTMTSKQYIDSSGKTNVFAYPAPSSYDYEYMAGVKIPEFKKRLAAGELLPQTPFTHYKATMEQTQGLGQDVSSFDSEGKRTSHYTFPDWLIPSYVEQWAIPGVDELLGFCPSADRFVTSASKKVYSQGFDGLTFVAELGSVKKMFVNLIERFRRLLTHTKPSDFGKTILELRYGWRPLIGDIETIIKLINEFDDSRTRYSQGVGASTTYSNVWTPVGIDPSVFTIEDTFSISTRGHVVADVKPPKFRLNVVTTGWELIRLSFVIDWFIGIGSWLESWSLAAIARDYNASEGHKVSGTRTLTYSTTLDSGTLTGSRNFQTITNLDLKVRIPTELPLLPSLGSGLNELKILDLMSLLDPRKGIQLNKVKRKYNYEILTRI